MCTVSPRPPIDMKIKCVDLQQCRNSETRLVATLPFDSTRQNPRQEKKKQTKRKFATIKEDVRGTTETEFLQVNFVRKLLRNSDAGTDGQVSRIRKKVTGETKIRPKASVRFSIPE
ncbi:hypothetical protein RUM44_007911 [Polyplax serrata]|uniref:Uncharacterized protein n=1 Tax=Polyplax serrata TaxID=468196 RepID=A0ABR1B7E7_POLSC